MNYFTGGLDNKQNKKQSLGLLSILFIIVLAVIILSYIELDRNKYKSVYSCKLPDKYIIIDISNMEGIKYPIYLYNSSKISEKDIINTELVDANNYKSHKIHSHLFSDIAHFTSKIVSKMKKVIHSKMPINSLYKAAPVLSYGVAVINPLSPDKISEYKVFSNKADSFESFISDNVFYIV